MTRKRPFQQQDFTRVLKAAQAAGVAVKIETEDLKMTITMIDPVKNDDCNNQWDIELEK